MVLENSSSPSTDFSYDDASPTADTFSDDSTRPQKTFNVYSQDLPRPLPIAGSITGWNKERIPKILDIHVRVAMQTLKRDPTQNELEALAYISAKEVAIMSYATPVGIAGGVWRAYNSRAEWRFPFWKPDLAKFNPEVFRLPGLGELLRGEFAKSAWRLTRFTTYAFLGAVLSNTLIIPYVAAVSAVGIRTDPRLKAFNEAMMKQIRDHRAREIAKRKDQVQQQGNPYGQGGTPMSDLWKNHRQDIGAADDASPAAGADPTFEDESKAMYDTSTVASNQSADRASSTPSSVRVAQARSQRSPPSQQSIYDASPSSQPFDAFDDASPTAQPPSISTSSALSSSGSAWDRIRQTSNNSGSPSPARPERWRGQPRQVPPSTPDSSSDSSDDGYYSSADRDRQLAQSEAQMEFDDRLERERRGGDFNAPDRGQGGGGGRRW